ncbi:MULTISPECIES: alpha/beta hydrolase [unclassified Streptomyces]|uniref:alpha/beta hydrolase n=1 Tax=unclassified Streptomyces TaxID=2593676 RepID=UPI002DDAE424|nr:MULTISPECIES: alpha/beta hydrolase [unclassified Streptomyces]WSF81894.1 alpha/beta hydrolase [Streptomyces sp. NBC_01744]WSC34265.1 alpha/beta hydrolase [Streptomyces sp. NBC_01763]WSC41796.1 alpha/beta hydrolase [Streptomyces sp. NBC_01763]WSC51058.1 alpha/beta hydrolase [Streptomyces sp. NBC_01761]WSC58464.1 alpha/beta hydrolase [Streptomyces sp. NBC_01761]
MSTLPTLVLVHGAWHGAWCWQPLIDQLPDLEVRTVALPSSGHDPAALGDLYDDAEAVSAAVAAVDGPTAVVGHSYGGCPVTQAAATTGNVQRIVYLTALMPDTGESVLSLAGGVHPSYWDIHDKPHGHGYFEATQPGEVLYNDVAPHLAQQSIASLGRQSLTSVTQPLTQAAWHTVPSTYILCEQDMAIPLPLQESMATRAQRTVLLHSGHSPFLSQPAELARILRQELTLQPRN